LEDTPKRRDTEVRLGRDPGTQPAGIEYFFDLKDGSVISMIDGANNSRIDITRFAGALRDRRPRRF